MKKNDAYNVFRNSLVGGMLLTISTFGFSAFAQSTPFGTINGNSSSVNISDVANGNIGINGNRGYIDWGGFNVGAGQTATFNFDAANGAILNRVQSGMTTINGNLNSNGTVYIVNPNGLAIGPGGVINAQGFVGSTLNMTDAQRDAWMNGNNTLPAPNSGTITHQGKIIANNVYLDAGSIVNTGGIIRADAIVTNDATYPGHVFLRATQGNIDIDSSIIATVGSGNIDIQAENGNVNFGIDHDAAVLQNSTLVNAYGEGNVNVIGKSVNLISDVAEAYISVGANKGTTNVTTTAGNLVLSATNGGYSQIGYHFHDTDSRVYSEQADAPANVLFSGFNFGTGANDRQDNERLAALYLPSGDINVNVNGGDLVVQASYDAANQNVEFAPAAHIGHAYLASDKEVGNTIAHYQYVQTPNSYFYNYLPAEVSGNINVEVPDGDILITSVGTSVAGIGHNVRNFTAYESNRDTNFDLFNTNYRTNLLYGNITAHSGRDVVITANNGGTAGIGHFGEDFTEDNVRQNGYTTHDTPDYFLVTAARNIELNADGSRIYDNNQTWKSTAQIGGTILGKASYVNYNPNKNSSPIFGSYINADIIALAGANVTLKDSNGGTSVIGHTNNTDTYYGYTPSAGTYKYFYLGSVVVGYGFNRYQDLDEQALANMGLNQVVYEQKKQEINNLFHGDYADDEGKLSVDGHSRIGRELISYADNDNAFQVKMPVAIFGFRLLENGDDAIHFADGSMIGNGLMDSSLAPGEYVANYNAPDDTIHSYYFRYNLENPSPYGTITPYTEDSSKVEYYGYSYPQYATDNENEGSLNAFGYLHPDIKSGKTGFESLKIFYAYSKKPDGPVTPDDPKKPIEPTKPIQPGYPDFHRPEEPRYPWFPVWYQPVGGCCLIPVKHCQPAKHYQPSKCCRPVNPCQVVTTCCTEVTRACEAAKPACAPAEE